MSAFGQSSNAYGLLWRRAGRGRWLTTPPDLEKPRETGDDPDDHCKNYQMQNPGYDRPGFRLIGTAI